jgi:hypothetical protein
MHAEYKDLTMTEKEEIEKAVMEAIREIKAKVDEIKTGIE